MRDDGMDKGGGKLVEIGKILVSLLCDDEGESHDTDDDKEEYELYILLGTKCRVFCFTLITLFLGFVGIGW
jgi:hypothetical protein